MSIYLLCLLCIWLTFNIDKYVIGSNTTNCMPKWWRRNMRQPNIRTMMNKFISSYFMQQQLTTRSIPAEHSTTFFVSFSIHFGIALQKQHSIVKPYWIVNKRKLSNCGINVQFIRKTHRFVFLSEPITFSALKSNDYVHIVKRKLIEIVGRKVEICCNWIWQYCVHIEWNEYEKPLIFSFSNQIHMYTHQYSNIRHSK